MTTATTNGKIDLGAMIRDAVQKELATLDLESIVKDALVGAATQAAEKAPAKTTTKKKETTTTTPKTTKKTTTTKAAPAKAPAEKKTTQKEKVELPNGYKVNAERYNKSPMSFKQAMLIRRLARLDTRPVKGLKYSDADALIRQLSTEGAASESAYETLTSMGAVPVTKKKIRKTKKS